MSKSLERKLIDICVFLHTELSSMQTALDDSFMDLSDILRLDPAQALSLITENIKDLLKVKRNFLQIDEYKNYKAHEQYQKALQKLESEVRNHIKIEQQMKIHIDSTQARLEELELNKDFVSFDQLRRENSKLAEKIKVLEKQLENNDEKNRLFKEIAVLKSASQRDAQKTAELMKVNHQLEIEIGYLKRKIEILNRENPGNKAFKENRPQSSEKKNQEEDLRSGSHLTERCRNTSRGEAKKTKSPVCRVDLKRTESQFLSSARGLKKCSTITERVRKQPHVSSYN